MLFNVLVIFMRILFLYKIIVWNIERNLLKFKEINYKYDLIFDCMWFKYLKDVDKLWV